MSIEIPTTYKWWVKKLWLYRLWRCFLFAFSSCSYSFLFDLLHSLFRFWLTSPSSDLLTFALWPGLCIAASGLDVSSESLFCPAELDSLFSYFDASGQRSSKYRTTPAMSWASSSSTTLSSSSHSSFAFLFLTLLWLWCSFFGVHCS